MCVTARQLGAEGDLIRNITLFAILIYELVGPLLTKMALQAAGEIHPMDEAVRNRRQHKLEQANTRKEIIRRHKSSPGRMAEAALEVAYLITPFCNHVGVDGSFAGLEDAVGLAGLVVEFEALIAAEGGFARASYLATIFYIRPRWGSPCPCPSRRPA